MSICKLCLEKRALRNSHIIPEFLYSPLYNEKRYMMGINGLGNRGWRPLQKGITEKLFCDACEQHFNKHHEIPFHRQWIDQQAAPNPWPSCPQDLVVVHVDYATFKLFHLSILFRASVSTHANFSDVKLGPHENQIREMLVANNPGASWQYPILGRALIKPVTRELVHEIITRPINVRFEGNRCYNIAYGGVYWWIVVSSHLSRDWLPLCLTEAGDLPLVAIPFTDLAEVHVASNLLRRTSA